MTREVDVAIIGAGTAGLSALAQVRRETDNYVLIDGGELGTTCARVGCMPSKAAIQAAEDFHRRTILERFGIEGGEQLSLNQAEKLEYIRDMRDHFVDQVLSSTTDEMGDEFIAGYAHFTAPDTLSVNGSAIRARSIVIAVGSRPVVPHEWRELGDRILTTDELFEQESLPPRMAVIGLGVIGLEMGQFLARIGIDVQGFDIGEMIGGLTDPVVNQAAVKTLSAEFPMHLGVTADLKATATGVRVMAGEVDIEVDKVLVCIGRRPNLDRLQLDKLGVPLNEYGVPDHDPHTMQIGDLPVFIAGDVTHERPILHEAGDEGKIAGYNAVHEPVRAFRRRVPLTITFCDPNIAQCGRRFDELDPDNTAIGEMPFAPLGRALIMGKNRGMLRLYADKQDGRLLGASMFGPRGESLAHFLALAIHRQCTVTDLLRAPFYHPTIEEAMQSALRDTLKHVAEKPAGIPDLAFLDTGE